MAFDSDIKCRCSDDRMGQCHLVAETVKAVLDLAQKLAAQLSWWLSFSFSRHQQITINNRQGATALTKWYNCRPIPGLPSQTVHIYLCSSLAEWRQRSRWWFDCSTEELLALSATKWFPFISGDQAGRQCVQTWKTNTHKWAQMEEKKGKQADSTSLDEDEQQ